MVKKRNRNRDLLKIILVYKIKMCLRKYEFRIKKEKKFYFENRMVICIYMFICLV